MDTAAGDIPAAVLAAAHAARASGRWADCVTLGVHAAAVARTAGEPLIAVRGMLSAGWGHAEQGRIGAAVRLFRGAVDITRQDERARAYRGPAHHDLAVALALAGQPHGATEMCTRALSHYSADDPRRVRLLADRGNFHLEAGRIAEARAALEPLAPQLARSDDVGVIYLGNIALAAALDGSETAAAWASRTRAALIEYGAGESAASGWLGLARAWASLHDREAALDALATAVRYAKARGERAILSGAQRVRSRLS